jgi:ketosteroid isomerase-like protein
MDMKVDSGAAATLARAYARAAEEHDARGLTSLYAEDCQYTLINRNAPPSRPTVLRGRAAVAAMYREACGREMTHRVEDVVAEGDRFAMHVTCLYPDGTRVAAMLFAQLADGLIQRETSIDCWDE